jgi:cbb3-type cytochrome c oxidase subunit III
VRVGSVLLLFCGSVFLASAQSDKISREDAKKLKSAIPYTKKSIAEGRNMFMRNCTGCHGQDGKATIDIMGGATDLTSPPVWKSGTSEGEIFRSIRDGAGDTMPSFKPQIPNEQDLWHLVNYVRSLWPDSMRPPLQDDKERH